MGKTNANGQIILKFYVEPWAVLRGHEKETNFKWIDFVTDLREHAATLRNLVNAAALTTSKLESRIAYRIGKQMNTSNHKIDTLVL